ncbi:rap1 GTPase-GDP dissociation stimulator 1-like [Solea senegalensis]|uniref:Rap1 GTPase-GDP dissociation stimulator 1-like n=1 Tax=Solea senegalensis TaxID=28829 RepID=A0AAV6RRM8_SOLSE|nr:rap1 GTPase-GDP dissociation stimulator 1-like [Solea senegalensis]
MGHTDGPLMYSYTRPHADKSRSSQLQTCPPNTHDNLNIALGAIRVLGLELIERELKPHLDTVMTSIKEGRKGAAEQVVISGILPILALSLRNRGPLTLLTAKLVAELTKESVVRKGFGDAGLVTALLSILTSADQELLFHAVRAISRMSYNSSKLQELLLRQGAMPRLVAILLRFPEKEALEEVCLQALCNLSGISVAEEAGMVWERGLSVRPVSHSSDQQLHCAQPLQSRETPHGLNLIMTSSGHSHSPADKQLCVIALGFHGAETPTAAFSIPSSWPQLFLADDNPHQQRHGISIYQSIPSDKCKWDFEQSHSACVVRVNTGGLNLGGERGREENSNLKPLMCLLNHHPHLLAITTITSMMSGENERFL